MKAVFKSLNICYVTKGRREGVLLFFYAKPAK